MKFDYSFVVFVRGGIGPNFSIEWYSIIEKMTLIISSCNMQKNFFQFMSSTKFWSPLLWSDEDRGLHMPGPCPEGQPGPDSTDNVQVWAGFGPGSSGSKQMLHGTFWAFLGHFFFANKKLFVIVLILC
jgi:hypothetical protein